MCTITLEAIDAFEVTEILEYSTERLDILSEDLAKLLFADCSPNDLDDLRADLARLITSPMTP